MNVRKTILAILAVFIAAHAPWRLMALFAETLVVHPGHYTRVSAGNDRYWGVQDLEARLERNGWKVKYEPLTAHGAYGMTVDEEGALNLETGRVEHVRMVIIDDRLSWNERLSVLAHEAGHTKQFVRFNESQGEVFAESVAMLVAHDGLREHARYLANLRSDLFVMVAYWRDIYRAASELEN